MTIARYLGIAFLLVGRAAAARAQSGGSVSAPAGGSGAVSPQISIVSGVPAANRPAPTGSGAISGVIQERDGHAPIAGASVTLRTAPGAAGNFTWRASTDSRGRFLFHDLPAGTGYRITISKPGFLDGAFAPEDAPPGTSRQISLADGEWFDRANAWLLRPGAIGGIVTDEAGDPVVGVTVRALMQVFVAGNQQFVSGPATLTDDRGAYRLADLGSGSYVIMVPSVQSSVAADAVVGAPQAEPPPAIDGDPGRTRLVLGRYPLPPPVVDGHSWGYAAAYYPDAQNSTRIPALVLKYGEHIDGADIRIQPVQTGRISGRLTGTATSFAGTPIRLVPTAIERVGPAAQAATTIALADGSFTFANVPPGVYTMLVSHSVSMFTTTNSLVSSANFQPVGAGNSGSITVSSRGLYDIPGISVSAMSDQSPDQLSGRVQVTTTGADVMDVELRLQPAASIAGRLVFADDTPPQPVLFSADSADGHGTLVSTGGRADANSGNTFRIQGLEPGQYFVRVTSAVVVKAVTWDGDDYTSRPLPLQAGDALTNVVLTLTNKTATLSGRTTPAANSATTDFVVLIFPSEAAEWTAAGLAPRRFRSAQTGLDGSYEFTNLVSGSYCVVAVPLAELRNWMDPAYLKQASALATTVMLDWGQKLSVDLRGTNVR